MMNKQKWKKFFYFITLWWFQTKTLGVIGKSICTWQGIVNGVLLTKYYLLIAILTRAVHCHLFFKWIIQFNAKLKLKKLGSIFKYLETGVTELANTKKTLKINDGTFSWWTTICSCDEVVDPYHGNNVDLQSLTKQATLTQLGKITIIFEAC
jgi:hypothetical protein